MSDPVTFSFSEWTTMFPEFAATNPTTAQTWFDRASFLCGNQTTNPLYCVTNMLKNAIYLLTAHIAWLNAPRDATGVPAASGQPAPPIVGRINSASEGSVSLGADMGNADSGSPSQAWYMQTKYGAEYWAVTACVRTANYVPNAAYVSNLYNRRRPGIY